MTLPYSYSLIFPIIQVSTKTSLSTQDLDINGTDSIIGPFEICNGTWLNPELSAFTSRYRVTKESGGNLVIRINGKFVFKTYLCKLFNSVLINSV